MTAPSGERPTDGGGARVGGVPREGASGGGAVADTGEDLAGGGDSPRGEPVEGVRDRGAGLVVGLGLDGLLLDDGRLLHMDETPCSGLAGVPGEPRRGLDDGRGVAVGPDGDAISGASASAARGPTGVSAASTGLALTGALLAGRTSRRPWPAQHRDGEQEGCRADVEGHTPRSVASAIFPAT